jgi:hypothetical protein
MKAVMPYTFRTGGIVDAEAINGNLRAGSGDVGRNLAKRYTYSQTVVPISGVANTDTAEKRTIFHRNPVMTLVAVEAVIYSASGATWTIDISNGSTTDSFSVATAGATTKASGGLSRMFSVAQGSTFTNALWSPTTVSGNSIVLSCSTASTITHGYLVLHYRGDRADGADHSGYTPSLVQATTSSAGSILDTQLNAFAAAVARDTNNANDYRVECFVARNFTSVRWDIASGAGRQGALSNLAVVGVAGRTCDFTVTPGGSTVLVATGTTGIVFGTITPTDRSDDPTTAASDTVVRFISGGGSIDLAYAFIAWR